MLARFVYQLSSEAAMLSVAKISRAEIESAAINVDFANQRAR